MLAAAATTAAALSPPPPSQQQLFHPPSIFRPQKRLVIRIPRAAGRLPGSGDLTDLSAMDTSLRWEKELLYELCADEENKFGEIQELLEGLNEDQRREVVRSRYRGYLVSES